MIRYEHKNYDWYVAVQRKLSRKKTNAGEYFMSWISRRGMEEINKLIHKYVKDPKIMVCHACRSGLEVDVLQKLNPDAVVWGTDIYGEAYQYDKTYFKEMDFDVVPPEWVNYFDVVYSNSIDHSRDPINTLLAWKSEIKDTGICFVNFQWGRGVSREDCFHLDPEKVDAEISEIAEKVGMKILYVSEASKYADGANSKDVVLSR